MNPPNPNLILYGQPTHSEKLFMISWSTDLNVGVSLNSGTTIESTESDAQSAPPFDEILESITNQFIHLLESKERQLPTEWSMPDLVRAVNGEDFSTLVRFMTYKPMELIVGYGRSVPRFNQLCFLM
jgi:hypothetical protein